MDANTLTAVSIIVAATPTWILAYKGLRQGQTNGDKADYAAITASAAGTAASTAALKAQVAASKAETAAGLAQETSIKTDVIIAGNKEIHTLVNSNTDRLKEKISQLETSLLAANDRTDKLAATVERLLATAAALNPAQRRIGDVKEK